MKLKEIKKNTLKRELSQASLDAVHAVQLCTPWVQVMSADIPVK